MRYFGASLTENACGVLLGVASRLVPGVLRADWLKEWSAELWYARRLYAKAGGSRSRVMVFQFCLGAFRDALALREQREVTGVGFNLVRGSARECGLVLLALLAVSLGMALLLPQVRMRLWPSFMAGTQDLTLIENTMSAERGVSTLPRAQYLTWAARRQRIFQSFAFYRVGNELIGDSSRPKAARVAYASGNVFGVLGSAIRRAPQAGQGATQGVVVSREIWRAYFEESGDGGARRLRIGSQTFPVRGVAPAPASSLPGHPDVWVLDASAERWGEERGFILGRLNPHFHEADWGERWSMSAPEPDGTAGDFTCISMGQALRQPWEVCLFGMMLALLALPATTSLPLGDYRSRAQSGFNTVELRRWGFLLGKMGLVLAAVYCTSMDLAFAIPRLGTFRAEYVQLGSSFALCLWGMRWTLRDQRQRCPVCLSRLTHPARVGQPSWSFLAWNGTELICAGGHGLLHVPELPTSWFSTQRWLYLDGSWQVLFAPSQAGVGVS